MASLEEYLDKVAADNGLTSVAIGRMPVGERVVYTASVHYDGPGKLRAALGNSETSIREALYDAIQKAQADRTPVAYVPCAIPSLEVPA